MRERLIRIGAPAVIVVAELEAPLRLIPAVDSRAELLALVQWIDTRPHLRDGLALLVLEQLGKEGRADAWTRALLDEGGGIKSEYLAMMVRGAHDGR